MDREITIDQVIGARIDRVIADLAERQHGIVARLQLLALGVGRGAIDHRLACGRLHLVHPGVYAVGHRVLSKAAWWMAAVLASGDGAVLSHRAAGARWGLRQSSGQRIEVTVPRRRYSRPGIQPHVAQLPADEVTVVEGIPVTTPPRTLLDLAAVLPLHALRRSVNEAEVLRLSDPLSLADLLARHPRRSGVADLRRIVEEGHIGATITAASSRIASSSSSTLPGFPARSSTPASEVWRSTSHGARSG